MAPFGNHAPLDAWRHLVAVLLHCGSAGPVGAHQGAQGRSGAAGEDLEPTTPGPTASIARRSSAFTAYFADDRSTHPVMCLPHVAAPLVGLRHQRQRNATVAGKASTAIATDNSTQQAESSNRAGTALVPEAGWPRLFSVAPTARRLHCTIIFHKEQWALFRSQLDHLSLAFQPKQVHTAAR